MNKEYIQAKLEDISKLLYEVYGVPSGICEQINKVLLKSHKQEKALEIIKEKNVDIFELKCCSIAETYNNCISFKIGFVKNYELTKEEFEILKEVLENEKNN